jgi:NAD(P)-dependent dehydrogenase (short-subunit alcohol dehydrogenase family)
LPHSHIRPGPSTSGTSSTPPSRDRPAGQEVLTCLVSQDVGQEEASPVATDLDLSGKVALVTGASKGIGAAIARAYAEHGARVMLSSRKQEALEETAKTIDGETAVYAANAGNPEQARGCVSATLDRFGALDILVNNAATNPYYGRSIEIDLPRFDKIIEVNLRGPLVWTQEAWSQSMAANGGSVINISSVGAMKSGSSIGIYDMTKAAIIHLTKQLAVELGPDARVNAIAPGLVKTDFARALWEPEGDEAVRPWALQRLGEPDDIAGAALYLASDLARWVTGTVLVVDGGNLLGGYI